jgi:hypothetical protein
MKANNICCFSSDFYLEWLLAIAFVGGIAALLNYRWVSVISLDLFFLLFLLLLLVVVLIFFFSDVGECFVLE